MGFDLMCCSSNQSKKGFQILLLYIGSGEENYGA